MTQMQVKIKFFFIMPIDIKRINKFFDQILFNNQWHLDQSQICLMKSIGIHFLFCLKNQTIYTKLSYQGAGLRWGVQKRTSLPHIWTKNIFFFIWQHHYDIFMSINYEK